MSAWFARVSAVFMLFAALAVGAEEPGAEKQRNSGERIYREVCQACHMPGGQGAHSPTLRVPALAGNPTLGAVGYPIFVILNGRGAMPWFNGVLTPAQIAAVTGYVRTNFGNNFPEPVTEREVQQLATPAPTAEP